MIRPSFGLRPAIWRELMVRTSVACGANRVCAGASAARDTPKTMCAISISLRSGLFFLVIMPAGAQANIFDVTVGPGGALGSNGGYHP